MENEPELTTALVLSILPRGESSVLLDLLTPHGWRRALKRLPKVASGANPDLFDTAEIALGRPTARGGAQNPAAPRFLDAYRPLERRTEISRVYPVFHRACQWAAFWTANGPFLTADDAWFTHAEAVLGAFCAGQRPATVLLKSLYWLAKREGYGIDTDWLGNLDGPLAQAAGHCLRQPIRILPPAELEAEVLVASLAQWLAEATDFTLPPSFGIAPTHHAG